MSKKVTDWFPPEVKPVRVGVYEIEFFLSTGSIVRRTFQYWNGRYWCAVAATPELAEQMAHDAPSCFQGHSWRGLAEPPVTTILDND